MDKGENGQGGKGRGEMENGREREREWWQLDGVVEDEPIELLNTSCFFMHAHLQMQNEIVFTSATMEELRQGLDWTLLLNIPPTAMLSANQMADLAISDGTVVRPFSHVMYV